MVPFGKFGCPSITSLCSSNPPDVMTILSSYLECVLPIPISATIAAGDEEKVVENEDEEQEFSEDARGAVADEKAFVVDSGCLGKKVTVFCGGRGCRDAN
jgi:hypothetical protein